MGLVFISRVLSLFPSRRFLLPEYLPYAGIFHERGQPGLATHSSVNRVLAGKHTHFLTTPKIPFQVWEITSSQMLISFFCMLWSFTRQPVFIFNSEQQESCCSPFYHIVSENIWPTGWICITSTVFTYVSSGASIGDGQSAVASNIANTTYRLQWWDFTKFDLPEISNGTTSLTSEVCWELKKGLLIIIKLIYSTSQDRRYKDLTLNKLPYYQFRFWPVTLCCDVCWFYVLLSLGQRPGAKL